MPGGVRESSCKTDIIEMVSKGRALWCHALTKNRVFATAGMSALEFAR